MKTQIQGSYQFKMLIEIAPQQTLNFVDKLNIKIHKSWYSTNIIETTVYYFVFVCLSVNKSFLVTFFSATNICIPHVLHVKCVESYCSYNTVTHTQGNERF